MTLKKSSKPATNDTLPAPPAGVAPSASTILTAAAAPTPSPLADEQRITEALAAAQAEVSRLRTAHEQAVLDAEMASPSDAVPAEQHLADIASELAAVQATVARLQAAQRAAGRAAARERNANKRAADAACLVTIAKLCEARGDLATKIDGIAKDLRREYETFVAATRDLAAIIPRDLQNGGAVLSQFEVDGAVRLTLRQLGFDWALNWAGSGAVPSMSDRVSAGNYYVAQQVDPDFKQRTAS